MKGFLLASAVAAVLGAGCLPVSAPEPKPVAVSAGASVSSKPAPSLPEAADPPSAFGLLMERAGERITKKPFGLYVTPKVSPVSPERFTGYHLGVDFETFEDEQDRDVEIHAICDGELALKKTASGYGGVAVQRCKLGEESVTVVYGHLKLSSIARNVGERLERGDRLGVLGKGFSEDTDGERKHLHLGIHRGTTVTIAGYTPRRSGLEAWLDARTLLPL